MADQREKVEMVDGRVYFSDDNWRTVWKEGPATKNYPVTDKAEADLVRFIAVSQGSWQGDAF